MKPLFFFLLSLFYAKQCEAQKAVVASLRMNTVYIGVANQLDILVEGYKWDEIDVRVDNGKIVKNTSEKTFDYYPVKQGKTEVVVFLRRQPSKIIGKKEFRIRFLPDVVAGIDWIGGGKLRKDALINAETIHVFIKGFDFDPKFETQFYSVVIIRNDSALFVKNDYSEFKFPDILKREFKKTRNGDKVIFYNLTYKTTTGDIGTLSPINFTIEE